MKGLACMPSVSNQSPYASSLTTGAKGRNSSRNLILALRWSFISAGRGSARIERAPERPRTPFVAAVHDRDDAAGGEFVG